MTSPYVLNSKARLRSEDPIKLIEQLQDYILKLQRANEVPRRQSTKRFYEKLSFDFTQSRDLPPTIRAIVEDNRMLRKFIKEWRGRCLLAENESQRSRILLETQKKELDALKNSVHTDELETLQDRKALQTEIEGLRNLLQRKENQISILNKKQLVDSKLHQAALGEERRQRFVLNEELSALREDLEWIKRLRRADKLELKNLVSKTDGLKKKTVEWKRQIEELRLREKELMEVAEKEAKDMIDCCSATDPCDLVYVMLCLITNPDLAEVEEAGDSSEESGQDSARTAESLSGERVKKSFSAEAKEAAATKLQCAFRGFLAKKELERKKAELAAQMNSEDGRSGRKKHKQMTPRHRADTMIRERKSKTRPVGYMRSKSQHPALA